MLGSLVKNWSKEFNKWLGTQKLNVYMVGTQNQNERRAEDYHKFTSVCPVLIVSYEMFNRTAQSLKVGASEHQAQVARESVPTSCCTRLYDAVG